MRKKYCKQCGALIVAPLIVWASLQIEQDVCANFPACAASADYGIPTERPHTTEPDDSGMRVLITDGNNNTSRVNGPPTGNNQTLEQREIIPSRVAFGPTSVGF